MSTQTIKIGNMCCGRCITAVKQVLIQFGIKHKKVELGFAEVYNLNAIDESTLEKALRKSGFEIVKSKEEDMSEKIKIAIHKIFNGYEIEDMGEFHLKEYLESQIKLPYKKLSVIFAQHNKKTVETYFIIHKIEKVKAMIDDTDNSFSEIAFKLGYKALSHLSRQFRAIEGVSMHDYKLNPIKSRKFIDKL